MKKKVLNKITTKKTVIFSKNGFCAMSITAFLQKKGETNYTGKI